MGVISKQAVEDYLNRPLKNLGRYKRYSTHLNGFYFHTDPYRHQRVCINLCRRYHSLLIFLEMGLGKTKVMLDSFFDRYDTYQVNRGFILVPTISSLYVWVDECKKHTPLIECIAIEGSKKARESYYKDESIPLVVATYSGWQSLLCIKRGNKLVPDEKKIKDFCKRFRFLVFDECTALKNYKSLNFKLARKCSNIKYKYGLTGTPIGRDVQDLWSQFYAVDGGETLGTTLGIFRSAFFTEKKGFGGWREYKFRKRMMPKLNKMLQNRSITYQAKECMDLPKQTWVDYPVLLSAEANGFYNAVMDQKDTGKIVNIFMKLRQIASGFMKNKGEYIHFHNTKMEELFVILELIPEDDKVVIFNEFIHSGDLISKEMDKRNMLHCRIFSKTKKPRIQLQVFNENPQYRFLIANNQSASLGLNLQVANWCITYEPPTSSIVRQQALKRIYRTGQKKRVLYYNMVVRNTVEEKIYQYLAEGRDLLRELIRKRVGL